MKHFYLFAFMTLPMIGLAQKKGKTKSQYRPKLSRAINHSVQRDTHTKIVNPYNDYVITAHSTGDFKCSNISPKYEYNNTSLTIRNGGMLDMVLKVVKLYTDETIRILYIRSGESVRVTDFPQGKYYFKEAHGKNWRQKISDGKCIGMFADYATYNKGNNIADFTISKKIEGNYEVTNIPKYSLELGVIITEGDKPQSNYTNKEISLEEFNK